MDLSVQWNAEIRTSSLVLGRFTLVPFPDTVQQTHHSKSKRFRSDFGPSDFGRESWNKKLDRLI